MIALVFGICLVGNLLEKHEDIAVVARIYSQPRERRPTHHRVFLCGLHGENRRPLGQAKGDIGSVWWKDRWHLLWNTKRKGRGYDENQEYKEIEFDLRTGRVKQVGLTDEYMGHPELAQFRPPPIKIDSLDKSNPASFFMKGDMTSGVIASDDRRTPVKQSTSDLSRLIGAELDAQTNLVFVCSELHMSDFGAIYTLHSLDWLKAQLNDLFDAHMFDFSPRRELYAAVDHRDLADYTSNKSVWVAKARVGNWKTGKEWVILGGMVEAISIAIRPGVGSR